MNPKLIMRIKKAKLDSDNNLIYETDLAGNEIEYWFDGTEFSIKSPDGISEITYQVAGNSDSVDTSECHITVLANDNQFGAFGENPSGIFEDIKDELTYYRVNIFIDLAFIELEGNPDDLMLFVKEYNGVEYEYQYLYDGFIANETFRNHHLERVARFSIRPTLWFLSKLPFKPIHQRTGMATPPNLYYRIYTSPRDVVHSITLYDNWINGFDILGNLQSYVYAPKVQYFPLEDMGLLVDKKINTAFPFDLSHRTDKYFIQLEESTRKSLLGSDRGYRHVATPGSIVPSVDYSIGKAINPQKSGFKDWKSAHAYAGIPGSTYSKLPPYDIVGQKVFMSGVGDDREYTVLANNVKYEWTDSSYLPVITLLMHTNSGRYYIGRSKWDGRYYDMITEGGVDYVQTVIYNPDHPLDYNNDSTYIEEFLTSVTGAFPRNILAFGLDTNGYYSHTVADKRTKMRIGGVIKQFSHYKYNSTFDSVSYIVETSKDDTKKQVSHTSDVTFTYYLTEIDEVTDGRFDPLTWPEYKAFRSRYENKWVWCCVNTQTIKDKTHAYLTIMHDDGEIVENSLFLPNVNGDVYAFPIPGELDADYWDIFYCGVSNEDLRFPIIGHYTFYETEDIDEYYKIPYLGEYETYGELLKHIRNSYGYMIYSRPNGRLKLAPVERLEEYNRTDHFDETARFDMNLLDSGMWDQLYDQVTANHSIDQTVKVGNGYNLDIDMPLCQSRQLAKFLALQKYNLYGYQRLHANIGFRCYYTDLFNEILIKVPWLIWKISYTLGLDAIDCKLELIDVIINERPIDESFDCFMNGMYYYQGTWGFYGITQLPCPDTFCNSCNSEASILATKLIELANSSPFRDTSDILRLKSWLLERFDQWRDEWESLYACIRSKC